MRSKPATIVVMGVCGVGKTAVGQELAGRLEAVFDDADSFHSAAAKEKMRAGTALTDEDRWPWLERLRQRIVEVRGQGRWHVLACSALRAAYRERLRGGDEEDETRFVLLDGSRELILERMRQRKDHYMPSSLLDSQVQTLERSPDLIVVAVDPPVEEIATQIVEIITGGARA